MMIGIKDTDKLGVQMGNRFVESSGFSSFGYRRASDEIDAGVAVNIGRYKLRCPIDGSVINDEHIQSIRRIGGAQKRIQTSRYNPCFVPRRNQHGNAR